MARCLVVGCRGAKVLGMLVHSRLILAAVLVAAIDEDQAAVLALFAEAQITVRGRSHVQGGRGVTCDAAAVLLIFLLGLGRWLVLELLVLGLLMSRVCLNHPSHYCVRGLLDARFYRLVLEVTE